MMRNLLPQEEFLQKILIIDKDAKVSVRPFDISKEMDENSIKIGDFQVDWDSSNAKQPPTIEQINAISTAEVNTKLESDRKSYRDELTKYNLGFMASFMAERKNNPTLSLSEYLDELEYFINNFEKV